MYYKAIITKNNTEIWEIPHKPTPNPNPKPKKIGSPTLETSKKRRARRIINNLRRLANNNFTKNHYFITLTFSQETDNLRYTNAQFHRFIMRVHRYWVRRQYHKGQKLRFIVMAELNERGYIHYHLISNTAFNFKYITDKRKIKEINLNTLWQYGFVNIKKLNTIKNIGAYMAKYMIKSLQIDNIAKILNNDNNKLFWGSRSLEIPTIMTLHTDNTISFINIKNPDVIYSSSYESDYHGMIFYQQLNKPISDLYSYLLFSYYGS